VLLGTDLAVSADGIVLGSAGPQDDPSEADVQRYYGVHWRFFETRDRGFAHVTPIQGRWPIDAVGLSRRVLDRIYRENARRLLRLSGP